MLPMSAQHAPGQWDEITHPPRPAGPTSSGTPLGRIVLGVFLGLLAWTVVMGVISAILATTLWSSVSDDLDNSSTSSTPDVGSSLSAPCRNALDQGATADSAECDSDDPATVIAYLATKK